MKEGLKGRAIALRKEGKTYREIRSEIPVAKSTLSDWLKSVGLSVPQQQRITEKRINAALRGAQKRKDNRLSEVEECLTQGLKDIGTLTDRELWLIGVALYWAEGSKQNKRSVSTGIIFGNSDHRMLIVFLKWLKLLEIKDTDIVFELYVHVNRKEESEDFGSWWSKKLGISKESFQRVYIKKGNPMTRRTNIGDLYHGLLRIKVRSSARLNRSVQGWTAGMLASVEASGSSFPKDT